MKRRLFPAGIDSVAVEGLLADVHVPVFLESFHAARNNARIVDTAFLASILQFVASVAASKAGKHGNCAAKHRQCHFHRRSLRLSAPLRQASRREQRPSAPALIRPWFVDALLRVRIRELGSQRLDGEGQPTLPSHER